jgi:hypothetical protein
MRSQRGEERGIDPGVGTAERDEGIVTQVGDHTDLTALVQRCRYLVVDAGGCAERRGRNKRPVVSEVVTQYPHAISWCAEDVTRLHLDPVQAQFSPGPAGQARWRDRPTAEARTGGIDYG